MADQGEHRYAVGVSWFKLLQQVAVYFECQFLVVFKGESDIHVGSGYLERAFLWLVIGKIRSACICTIRQVQLDFSLLVCRIRFRIISRTYTNVCSRHRLTGPVDHADGDLVVIVFVECVSHGHVLSGYCKLLLTDSGERFLCSPVGDRCRYLIFAIRQVISVICFTIVWLPPLGWIDVYLRQCIFFDVTRCKCHFVIVGKRDGDGFVFGDVYFSFFSKHVRIGDAVWVIRIVVRFL